MAKLDVNIWMPLYIGDLLRDTAGMPWTADAATPPPMPADLLEEFKARAQKALNDPDDEVSGNKLLNLMWAYRQYYQQMQSLLSEMRLARDFSAAIVEAPNCGWMSGSDSYTPESDTFVGCSEGTGAATTMENPGQISDTRLQ